MRIKEVWWSVYSQVRDLLDREKLGFNVQLNVEELRLRYGDEVVDAAIDAADWKEIS